MLQTTSKEFGLHQSTVRQIVYIYENFKANKLLTR